MIHTQTNYQCNIHTQTNNYQSMRGESLCPAQGCKLLTLVCWSVWCRWVESSFWNFDSLFQPQSHPARDAHDTFFIKDPASTLTVRHIHRERAHVKDTQSTHKIEHTHKEHTEGGHRTRYVP
jgi:hypothetical protein